MISDVGWFTILLLGFMAMCVLLWAIPFITAIKLEKEPEEDHK